MLPIVLPVSIPSAEPMPSVAVELVVNAPAPVTAFVPQLSVPFIVKAAPPAFSESTIVRVFVDATVIVRLLKLVFVTVPQVAFDELAPLKLSAVVPAAVLLIVPLLVNDPERLTTEPTPVLLPRFIVLAELIVMLPPMVQVRGVAPVATRSSDPLAIVKLPETFKSFPGVTFPPDDCQTRLPYALSIKVVAALVTVNVLAELTVPKVRPDQLVLAAV